MAPTSSEQTENRSWIRTREGGVEIRVRLSPRASSSEAHGYYGDRLKVRLAAPPVEGAANDALVRFLARLARVAPSRGRVVAGARERSKTVLLACERPREVLERLVRSLPGGRTRRRSG